MIDKTAIIHPSAQIADDAIIGPYVGWIMAVLSIIIALLYKITDGSIILQISAILNNFILF